MNRWFGVVLAVVVAGCGGGSSGSSWHPDTSGDGSGTVAPSGLTYSVNPAVYTVGTAIAPNIPTSSGGAVASYSVSPPLPAGLRLSTSTGIISGTPLSAASAAAYLVTANNAAGSTTSALSITVTAVPQYGDVLIYWQFSHTTPDGSVAVYDTTPAGTAQTYCPESGVEYVTIVDAVGRDVDPAYPTLNCVNELGDQGVIVRSVAPGTRTWTITGYRTTSNGDVALYESQFTFSVLAGHQSDVLVTVPGILDNVDLQAVMSTSGAPPVPMTCAQLGATTLSYSIVDWAGTETRYGVFPCSGSLPTVALGAVERDNYAVRMQALSASGTPVGDTLIPVGQGCATDPTFDHYAANERASIPVYDVRSFGSTCP